ncbi:MAG: nucleotidyltransferase domain-containing protein [Candidatus Bathyarchaeia archaeon]
MVPSKADVCLIGGYARGEVYPLSEVDLVVLRAPMENAQGKRCRCRATTHQTCKPNKALRSNLLNFFTERPRLSPL